MKIAHRYLLREFLAVLTCCVAGFVLLLVVVDLFEQVAVFIQKKPSPLQVLQYYGWLALSSLEYVVPAALLLSSLYTMWRFSRHNELQALRLGGFSLLSLAAPLLAAALVLSLGMVALKDRAVPRALRALKDATAKDAAREARRLRGVLFFNELGRRQWVIGEVDADHPEALRSPEVIWERADRSRHLRLTARRALHADGVWWFTDASLQTFDEQGHPVAAAGDRAPAQRPLAEFRELDEDPLDFVYESVSWDSLPTAAIRRHVQRRRDVSPQDRAQWKLHLHQRLSLPWACLIVTLFAIPAGMRGGRQRAVAGVLLAVGFFFGYYALMNCGTLLALRMLVPPWLGAWLSNIVFLGAGATLLAVQR